MLFKAVINVILKKSVLDPQGKTVLHALHTLGFQEAKDMRVGKHFEISVEAGNEEEARKRLKSMCEKLLINPVIEEYSLSLQTC